MGHDEEEAVDHHKNWISSKISAYLWLLKETASFIPFIPMKHILLIAAGLVVFYAPVAAQTLGSKTPYTAPTALPVVPPPGYTPFFINHVGRHGARHVTSLKELTALDHMLDSASLSPDGQRLRKMVRSILEVEKQYTPGSLSQVGKEEQYNIGWRMALHFPTLVADGISVTTTKEARTIQSAECFLKGVGRDGDGEPRLDSVHLRFFSLAPAYVAFEKKGPWKDALERLETDPATTTVDDALVHRVFTGAYPDARAFATAFYAAASITAGLTAEIKAAGLRSEDVDLFSLLLPGEAERLVLVDDAKDFLVKGPGVDAEGIQVRDAVPLLADFLNTAHEHLAGGRPGIDLRFAHAETIAPIAALMGLEGASTADTDLARYPDVWRTDRVMVYSGNIQWVFFRKTGADDLVEVLFNETPVHIPVLTAQFPFYRWHDVQTFYMDKLRRLGVDPHGDMYAYLLNLR